MTDINKLSINTIRTLAADVVLPWVVLQWPIFYFQNLLPVTRQIHTGQINRDRFVLSNGHACALQYIMLHLTGYDVTIDDLKQTPGHPEAHLTPGVEVTTGPLGQGFANAVGLAISREHLAAVFNKPGFDLFSNYTYVITGDGCLQEGVASEAASLAGHLQLGNLIVLYDDNHISIDGNTELSFTEDVLKRFEAYGWHTQEITDGNNDLNGITTAVENAKKVTDKPSIIKIRTIIGIGSKNQGTEKVHGSPLNPDDIANIKTAFGFDSSKYFYIPDEVRQYWRSFSERGQKAENDWNDLLKSYKEKYPEEGADLTRRLSNKLPDNLAAVLPRYTPSDSALATRKLSEAVLNKIADIVPELIGGSADLTESNLTRWKTAVDFQHPSTNIGNYKGRYIRYGVREHAMAAAMNGIAAYGGLIPFGGTFLNFITYAWGAVRLSALTGFRVIYVMTHDSIGLGEDGPTHQPIETLAALRALPNILVLRPADGNETSGAYLAALKNPLRPSVLALTRQNLPQLQNSSVEKTLQGGYVLEEVDNADITLVGTGSEVSLAVDAAKLLKSEGIKPRVVSLPSFELFEEQSLEYRSSVFPDGVPIVSVEAMSTYGWDAYSHAHVGMRMFGASGPYKEVLKKYGFTPENVASKARETIAFYKDKSVPSVIFRP
ncbi:10454_t:CDS:2 [Paraglomus occultum]|uniref:transketolase n=1 Tax=Paraglomus occultum TaxID=144539 RepID=A0A9N8WBT5_9GLOM|nr:10454_t:CDS:2 [Paraglomus occultum]